MKTHRTPKRKWWTRLRGFFFSRRGARPIIESCLEATKDHEVKEGDVDHVGVRELTPAEQNFREYFQWLMENTENPDLQASASSGQPKEKK